MQKNGRRSVQLLTPWGECSFKVQRGLCPHCSQHGQLLPLGLDASGLSPKALARVVDLCARLPFREACAALAIQGMKVSLSQCERLTHRYGEVVEAASVSILETLAERPLMATGQTRTMVVQADGVYVMERDKPLPGECEGREVKQVVIYPNSSPSERHSYASPAASDAFIPLAHGLLRWAGVKQRDQLVGVGDGAVWVDELFDTLGVERRILDIYHASSYLERVTVAMGWNETERETERRARLRGEMNGRAWFETYLPPPERCCQWGSEAQAALRYLLRRLDQMDYRDYKAKGWPIGSGQIEGANKAVIGARMKRGGMRWSNRGIPRMAALRSAQLSRRPLVNFHAARLEAFRQN